ncbi:hypothetical protein WJX84_008233 [Apatococcus fuscideae]|uniref:Uncharacterized protein n=1 Tax=Apatococcus fuscideae TaxID=2026836 RepID=A0AAW1SHY4_9CHLO
MRAHNAQSCKEADGRVAGGGYDGYWRPLLLDVLARAGCTHLLVNATYMRIWIGETAPHVMMRMYKSVAGP